MNAGRAQSEHITSELRLCDLYPDPRNARHHNSRNLGLIESSLRDLGAGRSILIDADGVIIAGNGVVQAAAAAGIDRVRVIESDGREIIAVKRSDLKGWARTRMALMDNRAAELAEWAPDVLAVLVEEMPDVATGMWDEEELAELLGQEPKGGLTDPDEVPEVPGEPMTKPGDLWLLGEHRVLCGDATKAEDVARVLAGIVPFLCVTDPPYGVNYDPSWRNIEAAKGRLAYAARRIGEVRNDDRADWSAAWAQFPGDVIYSWHPAGATSLVHGAALQRSGFTLRMQIIWAKSNFPIGRGDYHVRHEPCWYAVRAGRQAKRTDDRTQSTLWEINLDKNVEGGHSTQKPVECMARPMKNHEPCDSYDPFLGSGTTLIAAEQLGRRCYGLEIEPKYVDVIVRRWENFTGKKAELERAE